MAPKSFTEREIIAHHEAAHAVIAIELGLGILEIGIDTTRVEVTGGIGIDGCRLFIADLENVEPKELEAEQMRLSGQIDCSGTVLAAGPASDAKLKAYEPWVALQGQQSDLTCMKQLLRKAQLAPTQEAEEERLRAQLALAVEAINDPAVWSAIEAVARAVLNQGPLIGSKVEAIAESKLKGISRPSQSGKPSSR